MTASELVAAIEAVGGAVTLSRDGQRVRCRLPHPAESLLEEVRHQREDIFKLLKDREKRVATHEKNEIRAVSTHEGGLNRSPFADLVRQWLRERCVVSSGSASNAHILHREFSSWAKFELDASTEDAFVQQLQVLGFPLDESGMVMGLILSDDFLAAWEYERDTCVTV